MSTTGLILPRNNHIGHEVYPPPSMYVTSSHHNALVNQGASLQEHSNIPNEYSVYDSNNHVPSVFR